VRRKYKEVVRGWKDLERDFYSNGSLNNNLESEFKREPWRFTKQAKVK
jgi:hypothetical protein